MSSPVIQKKKSGGAVGSKSQNPPPFNLNSFCITKNMTKKNSSSPEGFLFATAEKDAGNTCCKKFHDYIEFFIGDLDNVKKFALKWILCEDYLDVFVNGSLVLRADSDLNFYKKVTRYFTCERSSTNKHPAIDIDLKPYLKKGHNSIQLTNLVGGKGRYEIIVQAEPFSSIDLDK